MIAARAVKCQRRSQEQDQEQEQGQAQEQQEQEQAQERGLEASEVWERSRGTFALQVRFKSGGSAKFYF
jgi:hypothetical protein